MSLSEKYTADMAAGGAMAEQVQILAADIGGTNSRFARFTAFPLRMVAQCSVPSRAESFAEVLAAARQCAPEVFAGRAACAAVAVAGPVAAQEAVRLTNVSYAITRAELLPCADKVFFLNDFEAQTRACATAALREAYPVLTGGGAEEHFSIRRLDDGVAVIGAGTGLGMAHCVRDGKALRVLPSEGGHVMFAFNNGEEQEFAAFVRAVRQRRYVKSEDVLSGRGLSTLHQFLTGEVCTPAEITAALDFTSSSTCVWFARMYARACRHLALFALPRGGMVITGGVAAGCPALVEHAAFREEFFCVPPPHDALLARIPVWLNRNGASGLWGAAQAACEALDAGSL